MSYDAPSLLSTPSRGRRSVWHKLLKDPQAVVTGALLLIALALAILAPILAPHAPNAADLNRVNAPVGTPGYPLGGDSSGRDILSGLLYSLNTSAVSAAIGTATALLVGVTAGLIGGYFGSRTRGITEWLFNLLMTFPGLILLIVLMPITKGDYRWTMLIFGVLLAPGTYRIVRNLVISVKGELYVEAARVSGLGEFRILRKHVLFSIRGPIIINAAFLMGTSIAVQSGLAFLGVGSKAIPSFGAMISAGFTNLYTAPLQFVWPSISLGVVTASLVLLGNSLRDALEGSGPRPVKVGASSSRSTASSPSSQGDSNVEVNTLLTVCDLRIAFPTPAGELREVVHGVSFDVASGEVMGMVGESGSGKTQTAFAILGVLPPEAVITSGSIRLEGKELVGLTDAQMRPLRGKVVAYIPQEPMSNLDPSYTVGAQLAEGIRHSLGVSTKEAKSRVLDLLKRVEIADPERVYSSYPHQISGGMAQRVLIAGAIASEPKLLIADEPSTALDVTVQAEILDLLRDLQRELDMAVVLVTHNFGVVADVCNRVAVMQQGTIVETGDTLSIFRSPQHSYTSALLGSILDEREVRSDAPRERSNETVPAGRDAQ